jgi:hypothetical protein
MENILPNLLDFIVRGVQIGLMAGVLAGAITWSIMKTPESIFRGLFGFALGFIGFAIFRGQEVGGLWDQFAAAAGGAIPRGVAQTTINLALEAAVAGLVGASLVLAVGNPSNTVRGALLGGLLGVFVGILLQVIIVLTGMPLEALYYSPLVGMVVLVVFAVFGAGS